MERPKPREAAIRIVSRTCEFLTLHDLEPVDAGTIVYEDGALTVHPAKGYERALADVLATANFVDSGKRRVTAEEDPAAWFEGLPANYWGSYFCAQFRDEPAKESAPLPPDTDFDDETGLPLTETDYERIEEYELLFENSEGERRPGTLAGAAGKPACPPSNSSS